MSGNVIPAPGGRREEASADELDPMPFDSSRPGNSLASAPSSESLTSSSPLWAGAAPACRIEPRPHQRCPGAARLERKILRPGACQVAAPTILPACVRL